MKPIDGLQRLTVDLPTSVLSDLREILRVPGSVKIPNEYAMDAIAGKRVRPKLSMEEQVYVNELVRTGRTREATVFMTESKIRSAKRELFRANRGAVLRDILIAELLKEALATRKEAKPKCPASR